MKMIKHMVMLAALAMAAPLAAEEAAADSSAAPAAAPASAQEIASGVCAGCHNADGNSVIPMNPILAGQKAEYITKQLMDFKAIPVLGIIEFVLKPFDIAQSSSFRLLAGTKA